LRRSGEEKRRWNIPPNARGEKKKKPDTGERRVEEGKCLNSKDLLVDGSKWKAKREKVGFSTYRVNRRGEKRNKFG